MTSLTAVCSASPLMDKSLNRWAEVEIRSALISCYPPKIQYMPQFTIDNRMEDTKCRWLMWGSENYCTAGIWNNSKDIKPWTKMENIGDVLKGNMSPAKSEWYWKRSWVSNCFVTFSLHRETVRLCNVAANLPFYAAKCHHEALPWVFQMWQQGMTTFTASIEVVIYLY